MMTNPIIEEAVKRFDIQTEESFRIFAKEFPTGIPAFKKGLRTFLSSELQTAISKTRESMVEEIKVEVETYPKRKFSEMSHFKDDESVNYYQQGYWRGIRDVFNYLSTLLPTKEKNE